MVLLLRISPVICAAALMSCASHAKKDDGPASADVKSPDHIALDSLKRAQQGKLSPMSQKTLTMAKAFGGAKNDFKTSAFSGSKSFHSGKDDFKTGAFSQSNKETRDSGTKFLSGKDNNQMGSQKFATGENSMGSKKGSDGERMFSGSGSTFQTKDYYSAEKAMRESRKPLLLGDQPQISEDQVQKLLNKR